MPRTQPEAGELHADPSQSRRAAMSPRCACAAVLMRTGEWHHCHQSDCLVRLDGANILTRTPAVQKARPPVFRSVVLPSVGTGAFRCQSRHAWVLGCSNHTDLFNTGQQQQRRVHEHADRPSSMARTRRQSWPPIRRPSMRCSIPRPRSALCATPPTPGTRAGPATRPPRTSVPLVRPARRCRR